MQTVEIILLLLFAVSVVAYFAHRTGLATPIAFVVAGVALAFVPGMQGVEIPPDAILLLFLPPLLTYSAYFTSPRDFKANLRPILQLAIGLVIFTCVVTAVLMNYIMPEMGLAVGFVLGAIISPPDAVAAVALTKHVQLPKKLVTILEGESLVNDATGLVLYQFAVAAVVTGVFSLQTASAHFAWMVVVGLGLGWLIGWFYMRVFPRIGEMSVEILSTFLVPYAAYLAAESLHASGVLAVVASGLTVGWFAPQRFTSAFRIPAVAVWRMVTFILEGLVFLLIGLHVPSLLVRLQDYSAAYLLGLAGAVFAIAVLTRFVWVYALAYGTRWVFPAIRKREPHPSWQNVFIVAWTGIRGVVSLATALALPLVVADGTAFPHRDLIIFLAFAVILGTLILQGISLPWLVDKLTLTYDGKVLEEEWLAKRDAAESAMKRLEELRADGSIQSTALERIVSHYQDRLESLGDGPNTPLVSFIPPSAASHPLIQAENQIWKEVLEAERKAVVCLRQTFEISDEVMHNLLSDIDLLHNRFAANV